MSIRLDIKKKFKSFNLSSFFETDSRRFALLGSSGSGKSTTLKCLAGLLRPDEGIIECGGKILYSSKDKINISPQKRRIAYLFQHFALFNDMSAESNIKSAFIPRIKKGEITKTEAKKELGQIISTFHLENVKSLYPQHLSFGQQQRVALARLVANNPNIIIFDEPFSSLDYRLKIELEVEIMDFLEQFEGVAIFVSHNKNEILSLCDELCVMKNGVVGANQKIEDFCKYPIDVESAKILEIENITRAVRNEDNSLYMSDWDIYLKNMCFKGNINYAAISSYKFDISRNYSQSSLRAVITNIYEDGEYRVFFCKGHKSNVLVAREHKNKEIRLKKNDTVYLSFDADDLFVFEDNLKIL